MEDYIRYIKKFCRNNPTITPEQANRLMISRLAAMEYGLTDKDINAIDWASI